MPPPPLNVGKLLRKCFWKNRNLRFKNILQHETKPHAESKDKTKQNKAKQNNGVEETTPASRKHWHSLERTTDQLSALSPLNFSTSEWKASLHEAGERQPSWNSIGSNSRQPGHPAATGGSPGAQSGGLLRSSIRVRPRQGTQVHAPNELPGEMGRSESRHQPEARVPPEDALRSRAGFSNAGSQSGTFQAHQLPCCSATRGMPDPQRFCSFTRFVTLSFVNFETFNGVVDAKEKLLLLKKNKNKHKNKIRNEWKGGEGFCGLFVLWAIYYTSTTTSTNITWRKIDLEWFK